MQDKENGMQDKENGMQNKENRMPVHIVHSIRQIKEGDEDLLDLFHH